MTDVRPNIANTNIDSFVPSTESSFLRFKLMRGIYDGINPDSKYF